MRRSERKTNRWTILLSVLLCSLSAPAQVVVGAIEGFGGASGLGGATYTIPIKVPEGLGGIQPSMAVAYNSQGGNGLLGWCWDIQGISSITRMGTTNYHDGGMGGVDFSDDRFALDGQRLICVSGTYGANNAEYRTETDCMAKIVSYTCDTTIGPAYFKVWLPNGNIAYYGNSQDSRIGLQQTRDVCLWLLNRMEDRNGNYMEYSYINGDVDYRLSRIDYGGNTVAGIQCSYSVRFYYGARADKEIAFIGDNRLSQAVRLDSILVKRSSTVLHRYLFDYLAPDLSNGYYYTRLHQVRFLCGSESYPPTVIQWGGNDYGNYGSSQTHSIGVTGGNPSDFSDKIKFTGDFNGDGYTDFILYYPNLDGHKKAVFFINKGEGNQANPVFFRQTSTITLANTIDWIYTADINGDGLDDILLSNRERPAIGRDKLTLTAYLSSVDANGNYSFGNVTQSFGEFRIKKKYQETILAGDFLGEGKQSFLLQECDNSKADPRLFYITYSGSTLTSQQLPQNMVLDADRMFACDFNGDGISEIYYMNKDTPSTGLLRMTLSGSSFSYQTVNNYMLSPWHQVFPGDFNGDGKLDLLTYSEDGNHNGSWYLNYFKESTLFWPEYIISEQTMGIGDPGTHGYSMKFYDNPDYKFITVGDFNGDGKADVAVRTESDQMKFLYGPVRRVDGQGQFASSQTVGLSVIGMNGVSNQTICVGNFLGRENLGMFSSGILHALNPVSNRYSVVHVTDGMGNRTSFEYAYLMPKPSGASGNDFYIRSAQTSAEQSSDMFTVSLPMKGLCKMTCSNIHCQTPVNEERYRYSNALVHKRGRGFLGFKSTTTEHWLASTKQRTVQRSSETLFTVPSLALKTEQVCRRDGSVIASTENDNAILQKRNPSTGVIYNTVFVPVVRSQTSLNYDMRTPQRLLNKTITQYTYNDSTVYWVVFPHIMHADVYDILKQDKVMQGVDSSAVVSGVNQCEFQTITQTTYVAETQACLQNWIINRPYSVLTTSRRLGGYSDVKSLTVSRYPSTGNPFLPYQIERYPGGQETLADTLATYVATTYTATGSPEERDIGDMASRLPVRSWRYEYSTDGRFMMQQTDPAGHATTYTYNNNYGYLISETDCNGLVTTYQSSPLGSSYTTVFPDGRVAQGQTSLDFSDTYAPSGCHYCEWSTSTGHGVRQVFFNAMGQKLRTLTQGMDGEIVLKDYVYDAKGLLSMESFPYFFGSNDVYWTSYTYDDYGRLVITEHPDGVNDVLMYDGPTVEHLKYLDDPDDPHITRTTVNAVGWTVSSSDENSNEVLYDHYADGKLKTTRLGNDAATAISVEYDAARNRITLDDPNYGTVRSVYDAFGQMTSTINPTGETTIFEYDVLGRMVKRREQKRLQNTFDSITWYYSESPGQKGLLDCIKLNNREQKISYSYDSLCRLRAVCEERRREFYNTNYSYDEASRISRVDYPTGYTLKREYTTTGHLVSLWSGEGNLLWETESKNALGQITRYSTGDGMTTERHYDPLTGRLTGILTYNTADTIQNLSYVYDKNANLASRTDSIRNMTESFTYDRLGRLTGIDEGLVATGAFTYDAYGRMTSKRIHGSMVFDNASYGADGRPHAIGEARVYSVMPVMDLEYTSFDKLQYVQKGNRTLYFEYGYDHQRMRMGETVNHSTVRMKEYVSNCVYVTEDNDAVSSTYSLTYLSGPLGVFAVRDTRLLPSNKQMYYIHPDNLGSWTTVTGWNGHVEQDVWFDAWGTPYLSGVTPLTPAASLMFDRGFTGHEHIFNFGLVNMNGRMYDPDMSGFLSVDNYVQDPSYTQNFNRYAYCLNNPLKYTDPDGESILAVSMIIGAVVCSYLGGTAANGWNYNPCTWSWDGKTWAGIGIGAIAGAAAGAAFAYAAPTLASTGFMAHFGTSGIISSYSLSGFATLGAGGYVAGFGGGMLYSNGDTHYSHLSGVQGFKVGATVGAFAGQLAGDIVNYKPPQKVDVTIRPENKWDGCYYQGSYEEFHNMMLETSKFFGVETKGYLTSKGYYLEPIAGDYAYRVCEIPYDDFCIYTSVEDKTFRYNLDYNCTLTDEGPYMNSINYCYRYTKMYADVNGRLYINPDGYYPAEVYTAYHTHPSNSYEGSKDMEMIFWMGVNGVIFGWNGCKHYYYPPW